MLDSPALIDWVAGGAATQAEKLGDLTVSMLRGEVGKQRKELQKLVHWLKADARPDVVHLSNAMLSGMAREIRRELRIPVVCTLSGEDIFLEKLVEPYYTQAREVLRERAADISAFVALNNYYADFMADYLAVSRERIEVIPHGLKLAGHSLRAPRPRHDPFTLGYFARVCPEKGLHQLVEAFRLLSQDSSLPPLRLRAAGYLGAGDRAYFKQIEHDINRANLVDRFQYLGEVDRAGKIAFLHSLDAMSVPTVYRESKGISILEALANGVPVVLPAHGTFSELIEETQGGLLCAPHDPQALADAIRTLVLDRDLGDEHGRRGHGAIHDRFHDRLMAERTLSLYRRVTGLDASQTPIASAV
jgi:glycosyltransferase involved in cell wall biosynthesis